MSKKIWIAGLLALALVVGVAGVAIAAPRLDTEEAPPPPQGRGERRPPHVLGEITELGDNSITMEIRPSLELTVEVTEFTVYLGSLESFDQLEVGMVIAVMGHRSGEGTLEARAIVAEEDLPLGTRIAGEVTAVTSSTIAIETRSGEAFRFNVVSSTEFLSPENDVQSATDIAVGDHVTIFFVQAANGTLTANVISVGAGPQDGPPPQDN